MYLDKLYQLSFINFEKIIRAIQIIGAKYDTSKILMPRKQNAFCKVWPYKSDNSWKSETNPKLTLCKNNFSWRSDAV